MTRGVSRGRAAHAVVTSVVAALVTVVWVLAGATPVGMPAASAASQGSIVGHAASTTPGRAGSTTPGHVASTTPGRAGLDSTLRQPGNLLLTAVTPPIAGPAVPVTVTGTVRSVDGSTFANPTVRVVRGRSTVTTQDALDAWVAGGDPSVGTEVGRASLPGVVAPATPLPFSMTIPPDSLRLSRAFGVVPIVIEVRSDDGITRGVIRTFIGWQRAPEYTPLSLATVVPITLDPDPALQSLDPALRAQAWVAAVGPSSRLARLVAAAARAGTPISYAVDPSILGPLKVAGEAGAQGGVSADLLAPTSSVTSAATSAAPTPAANASANPVPSPAANPAPSPASPASSPTGSGAPTPGVTSAPPAASPTPAPQETAPPATPPAPTVPAAPPATPDVTTVPSELEARSGFLATLAAATTGHAVYALPESDLDLAALRPGDSGSAIVRQAVMPSTRLAAALPAVAGGILPRVAWPVDGVLTEGLDERLRAAYRTGPDLFLLSATATRTGELTPEGAARTAAGTPVARWDDRLSAIAASAGDPTLTAEVIQRFAAQSAVLLAERPSIRRDAVIAVPRGLDPDAPALARFFQEVRQIPWLTPVGLDAVAGQAASSTAVAATTPPSGASGAGDAPSRGAPSGGEPGRGMPSASAASASVPSASVPSVGAPGPGGTAPTLLTDGVLPSITQRQATLVAYRRAQPASVGPVTPTDRWIDAALTLTSARWRANPRGFHDLRQGVEEEVAAVTVGLGVIPQTANFLADEGILLITVANDLDLPVADVTVHLSPTNARMAVAQPIAPISIAARSKATVPVRMVAVAQGLVPIDAWLTGPDGSRVGASTTIQVRAAPPGAWVYVIAGAVLLALLVFGAWRSLRRPSRVPDSVVLDPVEVTVEPPLEDFEGDGGPSSDGESDAPHSPGDADAADHASQPTGILASPDSPGAAGSEGDHPH
ncbi:MAG TPA: DUF6049 family protein [Dermatophilaceae bacterium]|nr:DUF6049 family protein [Dermatophilaceae bacterium]